MLTIIGVVLALFLVYQIIDWGGLNHISRDTIVGSGYAAQEERALSAFRRIEMRGDLEVFVDVGDPQHVSVFADDNLIPHIRTRVKRGTLRIENRDDFQSRLRPRVEITVPELEKVSNYGAGDCTISDMVSRRFTGEIYGAGELDVTGESEEVNVRVVGAGDADLSDLVAEKVNIRIMGAGDVAVHAAHSLSITLLGSGDIVCYGWPEERRRIMLGSGSIQYR